MRMLKALGPGDTEKIVKQYNHLVLQHQQELPCEIVQVIDINGTISTTIFTFVESTVDIPPHQQSSNEQAPEDWSMEVKKADQRQRQQLKNENKRANFHENLM